MWAWFCDELNCKIAMAKHVDWKRSLVWWMF